MVVLWLLQKLRSLLQLCAELAHAEDELPPVAELVDADLLQVRVRQALEDRAVHLCLTKQLCHVCRQGS